MSKQVGYARVSTKGQNLDRQLIELCKYVAEDMIVTDKASGKDFNRDGYKSLKVGIGKLVKGDTLYITALDRLGRNKDEMKQELEYFKNIGVRVKVIELPTTMIDIPDGQELLVNMMNNLLIEVLTTIAEQERKNNKERREAGNNAMSIDEVTGKRKSNKTGRVVGRPVIEYPAEWKKYYTMWKTKKITAIQAMEMMQVKKNSFYNLVKRYEEKNK